MEILNDTIEKAKDLFSIAKQKASEAVNVGKQKYDIASLESKTYRLYTNLGKAVYNDMRDNENFSDEIKNIISQINNNRELIAKQKEEIGKIQHKRECASCGAIVEEDAKFCNNCGEKLIFEE